MSEVHTSPDKGVMRHSHWELKLYKISLEIGFDVLFAKVIKYVVVTGHGATCSVLLCSRADSSEV